MKVSEYVLIVLLLISAPVFVLAHSVGTNAESIVHMNDVEGFIPEIVTLTVDETVIFENVGDEDHWPASDIHPTHELYSDFDTKRPIPPGEYWEFTFEEVGRWTMHDHLFPEFTGLIIVKEDSQTDGDSFMAKLLSYLENIWDRVKMFFKQDSFVHDFTPEPFTAPAPFDQRKLLMNNTPPCELADFRCMSDFLMEITATYGPEASTLVLQDIETKYTLDQVIDLHQLSHRIGRQTAKSFGINNQAFELCPMVAYGAGCLHGFFENSLGRIETSMEDTKAVALALCDDEREGQILDTRFNCYHAVGHGITMAAAYRPDESLRTCDLLENKIIRERCYSGVFMELVNGVLEGITQEGIFLPQTPLSPCISLDIQYQVQCFMNHAPWLLQITNNDLERASHLCLLADAEENQSACIHGFGWLFAIPTFQEQYSENKPVIQYGESTKKLCSTVPENLTLDCINGVINAALRVFVDGTDKIQSFCDSYSSFLQQSCLEKQHEIQTFLQLD